MAKLTHIDDVEHQRAAEAEAREMREAQETLRAQEKAQASATERPREEQPEQGEPPELDVTEQAVKNAAERTADEEADFHGLDSEEPMNGMQKALIVLALIVFVAAIAYVANTWFHFI